MAKYIMALDAGTTSNRCILFNQERQRLRLAVRQGEDSILAETIPEKSGKSQSTPEGVSVRMGVYRYRDC